MIIFTTLEQTLILYVRHIIHNKPITFNTKIRSYSSWICYHNTIHHTIPQFVAVNWKFNRKFAYSNQENYIFEIKPLYYSIHTIDIKLDHAA